MSEVDYDRERAKLTTFEGAAGGAPPDAGADAGSAGVSGVVSTGADGAGAGDFCDRLALVGGVGGAPPYEPRR